MIQVMDILSIFSENTAELILQAEEFISEAESLL